MSAARPLDGTRTAARERAGAPAFTSVRIHPPATVHRFERDTLIRFSHCDPAGIVFFPQYLVMFNALLEDWFNEALQVPYGPMVATRRVGTPTVSLNCDFTAISRMGDTVTLGLSVHRIGGASFHLSLGCRQGDEARVRMTQVLVTTSMDTHRPIPIPSDVRDAMLAFQSS
ncbi:MAG: acyl-CoA thioesterase [Rhizobacter sp.]|nr:acyl-CoA thioesterase [Rhizobacter sp.]